MLCLTSSHTLHIQFSAFKKIGTSHLTWFGEQCINEYCIYEIQIYLPGMSRFVNFKIQLENLERLHSEIPLATPWLPILSNHFISLSTSWPNDQGVTYLISTETQLIQAVHDWASTIDAKGQTDVLFLDFSKAFDNVPHRRLLNYNTTVLMARPATGLLFYCVADDKEWSSMELARPGHQCSQASLRAQWSVPYYSSFTSMTSPATSTHECDSLLTTASSTGKSAALKTTTSCKMTSPNSSRGQKDGRWHSSQKSATSSRSSASVTSANFCTTSTT